MIQRTGWQWGQDSETLTGTGSVFSASSSDWPWKLKAESDSAGDRKGCQGRDALQCHSCWGYPSQGEQMWSQEGLEPPHTVLSIQDDF